MLILLSPSKTQDFNSAPLISDYKNSEFINETENLAKIMRNFSAENLGKLMKISPNLSELNFQRFQNWNTDFSREKSGDTYLFKQAIFAFKGDVYRGINLDNWKKEEHDFAESSLRILSGFYGVLTPQTLMKPYRLEMGTRLSFESEGMEYKNLYKFWQEKLTNYISRDFETNNAGFILNLASVEYSKAINLAKFQDKVCNVDFKVLKNGEYKTVAIYAKRQRGEMSNWIIENKIEKMSDLCPYSSSGFNFSRDLSVKNRLVFVKK